MAGRWRTKWFILAAIVLVSGLLRSPLERRLTTALREQGFHPHHREAELAEQVGVQGALGMLGGLRYMVAFFLELQAYRHWEPPPQWERLSEAYRLITLLQPKNVESWDDAAWHHIYNASGYYRHDAPDLPPLQRELLARQYEERGVEILRDGIRWNPESLELRLKLAHALRERFDDDCAAARVYGRAAQLPDAPAFVYRFYGYSLAQCEGRERDAYEVLMRIYEEGRRVLQQGGPMIWKPTLIVELNRLERELDVPLSERIPERFHEERFRIATPLRPEASYELYRDLYRRQQERPPDQRDRQLIQILKDLERKLGEPRAGLSPGRETNRTGQVSAVRGDEIVLDKFLRKSENFGFA